MNRAVIKTALATDETAVKSLKREQEVYRLPSVRSSQYFRKLYEVIGNAQQWSPDADEHDIPCLALEWMDTTMSDMVYPFDLRDVDLFKSIMKSLLSSSAALAEARHVNSGTQVFCSTKGD